MSHKYSVGEAGEEVQHPVIIQDEKKKEEGEPTCDFCSPDASELCFIVLTLFFRLPSCPSTAS